MAVVCHGLLLAAVVAAIAIIWSPSPLRSTEALAAPDPFFDGIGNLVSFGFSALLAVAGVLGVVGFVHWWGTGRPAALVTVDLVLPFAIAPFFVGIEPFFIAFVAIALLAAASADRGPRGRYPSSS